jgi:hypothetical protein
MNHELERRIKSNVAHFRRELGGGAQAAGTRPVLVRQAYAR